MIMKFVAFFIVLGGMLLLYKAEPMSAIMFLLFAIWWEQEYHRR